MIHICRPFPIGESNLYYNNDLKFKINVNIRKYLDSLDFQSGDYNGREVKRLQRWYHTEHKCFHPNWTRFKRWDSFPYDPVLLHLQKYINVVVSFITKITFRANSILINKYNNGNNIIPKHRDSEEIFGDNPIIAVLSFGATRTLKYTPVSPFVKSVKTVDGESFEFNLQNWSLLIMWGTIQKYYCHEILNDGNIDEVRYSLTFREQIL